MMHGQKNIKPPFMIHDLYESVIKKNKIIQKPKMVGNCYNVCYSATVIHKKQSPTFDDELFQSHTAHGL
jgi:hypothetical protein